MANTSAANRAGKFFLGAGKFFLGLGNAILGGILGIVILALALPFILLSPIIRLVSKLTQNSNLAFQIKAIHMAFIYGFKGDNFLQKTGNALKFIARLLFTFVAQTIITVGVLSMALIVIAMLITAASVLLALLLVIAAPVLAIAIALGAIIGTPVAFIGGFGLGATNLLKEIATTLKNMDQTVKDNDIIEKVCAWRTHFVFADLKPLEYKHKHDQHHLRYPYLMLSTTLLLSVAVFVLIMTIPALTPILLAASPVFLSGFSTAAIGGFFSGVVLLTGITITTAAVLLDTCFIKHDEAAAEDYAREPNYFAGFSDVGRTSDSSYHPQGSIEEDASSDDDTPDPEVTNNNPRDSL